MKAFCGGGVDYITKPFHIEEVLARVETHLKIRRLQAELEKHNRQLEELVQAQVREMSDSQLATIFAIAKLTESHDQDTGRHLEWTKTYSRLLATRLSEQSNYRSAIPPAFIDNIFHASPLYDIGKVSIPDHILLKPGKLTPGEFDEMKTHTTTGALTLQAVRDLYP